MSLSSANKHVMTATDWISIGHLEDIPKLGARVVRTLNGDIAVFRNAQDEVYALLDRCPHKGGPLSQGIVYDRSVACPLHGWCIKLDKGRAAAPDVGHTPRYPVQIAEGHVYLALTPITS